MKYFFGLLLVLSGLLAQAQDSTYTISTDPEHPGGLIYKGTFGYSRLKEELSFKDWMERGATYTPDATAATALAQQSLQTVTFIVLMGTWCDDSQILVPRFFKLLSQYKYPVESITIIGLDRNKEGLNDEKEAYDISRVPTIIVYRDSREAGRIIESVQVSLESDLLAILRR